MTRRAAGSAAGIAIAAAFGLAVVLALPPAAVAQDRGAGEDSGVIQEAAIGIAPGMVPEAVVIEDLDGNPVDLAEFIGEGPMLIQFWAVWCENCEALHPRMEAAHERYGDRVHFVAVAVAVGQSKRAVRRHLDKLPVSYPTLWDADGRAVRAFQAPVTSYIVVLDGDGRVGYTGVGAGQDIEAAIEGVLRDEQSEDGG